MSIQIRKTLGVVCVMSILASAAVFAHLMLVKGTIVAIEAQKIQVKTGQEKTGDAPAWFAIDAKTKILRGKKSVTFAQAKIKVGERVVVNMDHGADGVMKPIEVDLVAR